MLECVINISEGRDEPLLADLARAADTAGCALLDLHSDPDHNRSVFTLAGPGVLAGAEALATEAVGRIDLSRHGGAHPRFGVVDVVPFVSLAPGPVGFEEARRARDDFAGWAGERLGLPCFLYGPERSLPDLRRHAFVGLRPDTGPMVPHPTAGAAAVGVRPPMVAFNLWLAGQDAREARALAARLRSDTVRALGFDLGGRAQLSFNLLDPFRVGPAEIYDRAVEAGAAVDRCELVGLVPRAVLDATPARRWTRLDLSPEVTVEARLARRFPDLGG